MLIFGREPERRFVDLHAMHDHRQLRGDGHHRALVVAFGCDSAPQALMPHNCLERTSIALAAS
jgi:hypothetical protein